MWCCGGGDCRVVELGDGICLRFIKKRAGVRDIFCGCGGGWWGGRGLNVLGMKTYEKMCV